MLTTTGHHKSHPSIFRKVATRLREPLPRSPPQRHPRRLRQRKRRRPLSPRRDDLHSIHNLPFLRPIPTTPPHPQIRLIPQPKNQPHRRLQTHQQPPLRPRLLPDISQPPRHRLRRRRPPYPRPPNRIPHRHLLLLLRWPLLRRLVSRRFVPPHRRPRRPCLHLECHRPYISRPGRGPSQLGRQCSMGRLALRHRQRALQIR